MDGGAFPDVSLACAALFAGRHFFLIPASQYFICSSRLAHSPQWSFSWSPLCFGVFCFFLLHSTYYLVFWGTVMHKRSPTTLWKQFEGRDHVIHLEMLAQVFVHRWHSLCVRYYIRVMIHLRVLRTANLFDLLWLSFKGLSWKIMPLGEANLIVASVQYLYFSVTNRVLEYLFGYNNAKQQNKLSLIVLRWLNWLMVVLHSIV